MLCTICIYEKNCVYDVDFITNFMLKFHSDLYRTFRDINTLLDTQNMENNKNTCISRINDVIDL